MEKRKSPFHSLLLYIYITKLSHNVLEIIFLLTVASMKFYLLCIYFSITNDIESSLQKQFL